MARLNVFVTMASPLLTGEPRRGDVYQSQGYLPGSVLRGAVANILMQDWSDKERQKAHPEECPDRDACDFCKVLYPQDGRPPRFYDFYPAMQDDASVLPFPHTARTCKQHGGFLRPEDEEERHGIFDTLVAQAAAQEAGSSGIFNPYQYTLDCPECGEPLEPPDVGHYGIYEGAYYSARPIMQRFSRTAINRLRHTAQDAQLFTLTVMGEQMNIGISKDLKQAVTVFYGSVDSGGADVDRLRQVLSEVNRLGSGSSRGLGQVSRVDVDDIDEEDSDVDRMSAVFGRTLAAGKFESGEENSLLNRLFAFNQAIAAERAFYQAFDVPVLPGRWYFSVDLLAETFVRFRGMPALKLTADILGLTGARLVFTAAEPTERGGWSNAWRLPRPRKLGLAPGGVFLYCVDDDDISVIQGLIRRFIALENEGIGEDRERGAGRLMICAPFHSEVKPR